MIWFIFGTLRPRRRNLLYMTEKNRLIPVYVINGVLKNLNASKWVVNISPSKALSNHFNRRIYNLIGLKQDHYQCFLISSLKNEFNDVPTELYPEGEPSAFIERKLSTVGSRNPGLLVDGNNTNFIYCLVLNLSRIILASPGDHCYDYYLRYHGVRLRELSQGQTMTECRQTCRNEDECK